MKKQMRQLKKAIKQFENVVRQVNAAQTTTYYQARLILRNRCPLTDAEWVTINDEETGDRIESTDKAEVEAKLASMDLTGCPVVIVKLTVEICDHYPSVNSLDLIEKAINDSELVIQAH